MTKRSRKQLAKIYYQNREIKNIEILLEEEFTITISIFTHISGKHKVTGLEYEGFDSEGKELALLSWYLEDDWDEIEIKHTDADTNTGAMTINWLSGVSDVSKTRIIKSSLFIPMRRILHISINDPRLDDDDDDEQPPKGIIDK